MSDPPEKVRRRRPRGGVVPERFKIVRVTEPASLLELSEFDHLWVDMEHTYVVATTKDEEVAKQWEHYRSYLRDSLTDTWGYEVEFGAASVANALALLRLR